MAQPQMEKQNMTQRQQPEAFPRGVKIHPAANIFPMMSESEYAGLLDDIRENGVQTRLRFLGDSPEDAALIDGRNRLKAIQELGLDYLEYADRVTTEGLPDPIQYVLSLNLHRRHLTASQRAMVAGNVANIQKHHHKTDTQNCASQISVAEAAKSLSVSPRLVTDARKVKASGSNELQAAVTDGKLPVSKAAVIAELPKPEQAAAIVEAQKPKEKQPKAESTPLPEKQPETPKVEVPSADDPSCQRAIEIIRDYLKAESPTLESQGWVAMHKATLTRVRQYCYDHRNACTLVLKDLRTVVKQVEGYRKDYLANKKSNAAHPDYANKRHRTAKKAAPEKRAQTPMEKALSEALNKGINNLMTADAARIARAEAVGQ